MRTPARCASRATPRLPAAIDATCVPCEPTSITDCGSRLVAAIRRAGAAAIAAFMCDSRISDP